jgi:hypothetical protein
VWSDDPRWVSLLSIEFFYENRNKGKRMSYIALKRLNLFFLESIRRVRIELIFRVYHAVTCNLSGGAECGWIKRSGRISSLYMVTWWLVRTSLHRTYLLPMVQ